MYIGIFDSLLSNETQMINSMANLFAMGLSWFTCVISTNTSLNLDTMLSWFSISLLCLSSSSPFLTLLFWTQNNSVRMCMEKSVYIHVCSSFLLTPLSSTVLRNWVSNFHGNVKSEISLQVINCQVLVSLCKFDTASECLDKLPTL